MSFSSRIKKFLDPPGQVNPGKPLPKPITLRSIMVSLIFMTAGAIMTFFTTQIYESTLELVDQFPEDLLVTSENFPNLTSIVCVVLIIWFLDKKRRSTVPYLVVALLLGGVVNEAIKLGAGRARPEYGIAMKWRQYEWAIEYEQEHPEAKGISENIDHWFWLSPRRPVFDNAYRSFPSGHTNSSFVLAAYLSALYPPARPVWFTLAVGCGLARTQEQRHYLEDTFFGGGLGWLMAQIAFMWVWPLRLGRRIETFIQRFAGRLERSGEVKTDRPNPEAERSED